MVMAVWFTADTHSGHANIIRLCRRPFTDVAAVDAHLVNRANERVAEDDVLYHLGDFSFRDGDLAAYRARICCRRMVLVVGNHDPETRSGSVRPEFAGIFESVHHLLRIQVPVRGEPSSSCSAITRCGCGTVITTARGTCTTTRTHGHGMSALIGTATPR
jgi:calcineurin-like phosphoesterase family protein